MKRMWIQVSPGEDVAALKNELKEIGAVEIDSEKPSRIVLTFHNQSEGGMRMAGFRLTEDFIQRFEDFGMLSEKG
ncbi:MAG: hypothetical protein MUF52_06190 [Syntrophobacteraceae bacterium]|nr:hypothetical protein [Syntrophobacteraceae bacterium]